jgi:sterol desaturase/sphingolipid hydroxylase (fatty acid hydroxylase superfamily)
VATPTRRRDHRDMAEFRRVVRRAASVAAWPVLMVAPLVAAQWGFARGYERAVWVFVVSTVQFVVIVALELVMPAVPGWSLLRDRQSANDIAHGVLVGAVSRPLSAGVAAAGVGLVAAMDGGVRAGGPWPHDWPMAAQVALGLAAWSSVSYWTHRWFHQRARLWWFHSLHHDPQRMQVLKGNRIHLGEDMLRYVVMFVPLLVLGASTAVFAWIAMWNNVEGALAHSNVDVRFPAFAHRVLPTPQNHRLHHADRRDLQDANYADVTPLWDALFGTYRHPNEHLGHGYGLGGGEALPSRFTDQLLLPLRPRPAASLVRRPVPA